MNQPNQTQPSQGAQPKKSGSNLALIIILIVIGALIVLGAGGYFGWKYLKAKISPKADTTKSGALSLKTLEETFKYPTGTVTKTDHTGGSGGSVSDLTIETPDKLQTVYNYYLNLAATKGLTVATKSMEVDASKGSLTLQGKGYYVNIYLYQYENTEIDISIFGDNIKDDTAASATSTAKPTATSNSSAKTTIANDYVIADSATRIISASELTALTPWQLKVARNEIYARHGRSFVHQDLQCYFNAKSWYQANPDYSDALLTSIDNKNIATILAYEQSINSPLLQVDSGC